MLKVIVGSGENKNTEIKNTITAWEEEGRTIVRKEARETTPPEIEEYLAGQGLFSEKFAVFVSDLEENAEILSFLEENAEPFGRSETPFVFEAKKLSKKFEDAVEKFAKIIPFKSEEKRENFFPLADAYGARDKKRAWNLLKTALEKGTPEEIHGVLWWQVKGMITAREAKSGADTDMKPFVYQKMKRAAANFSKEELTTAAGELFESYHDAHLGKGELGLLLEKFVLERL